MIQQDWGINLSLCREYLQLFYNNIYTNKKKRFNKIEALIYLWVLFTNILLQCKNNKESKINFATESTLYTCLY